MHALTVNVKMTRREFSKTLSGLPLLGLVLASSLPLQGCGSTDSAIVGDWVATEYSPWFLSDVTQTEMRISKDGTFSVTLTGVDTSKEDWPTYSETWTEGKWLQVSDKQYSLSCYRLIGYAPNPSMVFELSTDGKTLTCMDKDEYPVNTDSLAARITAFQRK